MKDYKGSDGSLLPPFPARRSKLFSTSDIYEIMSNKLTIETSGEGFYDITGEVQNQVSAKASGILHLFCIHTSCALTITEAYDPSAKKDVEKFLNHLAPRDLGFIEHTLEGPDDSPSHMKSALLHQNLAFIVEEGELLLGRWQGIYLAEFRDAPHKRTILMKFIPS